MKKTDSYPSYLNRVQSTRHDPSNELNRVYFALPGIHDATMIPGWLMSDNNVDILIFDKNFDHTLLKNKPHVNAQTITNEKDADIVLQNNRNYTAAFIDPLHFPFRGARLIKVLHLLKPGTPIYILSYNQHIPFKNDEVKKLAIQGMIQKPITYETVFNIISPIVSKFSKEEIEKFAQSKLHERAIVAQADKENYTQVLAMNFISGKHCYFDLFMRTDTGNYIQLFKSGEEIEFERLEKYVKKGLKYFYIHKDEQRNYLKYCEKITEEAMKDAIVPDHIKISAVLNLGYETTSFLQKNSIDEKNILLADSFIKKHLNILKEMNRSLSADILEFLDHVISFEHGVATATIGLLLADAMGFKSEKVKRAIVMAGLFHDVALEKGKNDLDDKNHPIKGALLLRKCKILDPMILYAVAEHHERRDGTGYPNRLSSGQINPISEIVSISDLLVTLIAWSKIDPFILPLVKVRESFNWYSFHTISGFEKMFQNRI